MRRSEQPRSDLLDRRKVDAGKVVDTQSLVSKYELLIKENEAGILSEERSIMLFRVLDNLLPHFGVFKPIMSIIRNELYEYVFSAECHTVVADAHTGAAIQRVPYYKLINDLLKNRDEKATELQSTVDALEERLFQKQKQFEDSMGAVADRNKENHDHSSTIDGLDEMIFKQSRKIKQLEEKASIDHKRFAEEKSDLNRFCDALQEDCAEKDREIEELSCYKHGYEDLDEAFLSYQTKIFQTYEQRDRFDSYIPQESIGFSTKKEHLVSDIQTSKKLEDEILTVMNTMIEQFDEFLEAQMEDLARKELEQEDILEQRKVEREVNQADQELWSMQERFKSTIEEVNNELKLQRQHCSMLEEKLQTIEMEEQKKMKKSKKPKKMIEKGFKDKVTIDEIRKMSLDMNDYRDDDYEEDDFIPHERIFSKYAVMLYYSQDAGKTWYLHQDCSYCDSCHEKTISCPHKVLGESTVILAPHRITHLKLKRPSVKITKELPPAKRAPTGSQVIPSTTAPSRKSLGSGTFSDRATSVLTTSTSPAPFVTATSGNQLVKMKHALAETIDDYQTRTDIGRPIGRHLTLKRTRSLYEQFQAYIAWQDQNSSDENGYGSVVDNVYEFFAGRYIKDEAKFAAVHDFLSSVIRHASENRDVQLFGHSLVGNIDFAACRYILTFSDYIETIEWKDVEDFRSFASCVYPFILDEDLESIQMGYVSFSENKISKLHVFDYVLYLTLKGREPRIQDLEQQLMQYPSRDVGIMNYDEFCEAADHVLQIPNERVRRTLFCETLLLQQVSQPENMHIHVSKLACILAHMQLIEQSAKLKETIYTFIEENRPTHEESLGVHGHVVKVDADIHLLTMNSIKKLSFNTARRDKFRRERMETQSM